MASGEGAAEVASSSSVVGNGCTPRWELADGRSAKSILKDSMAARYLAGASDVSCRRQVWLESGGRRWGSASDLFDARNGEDAAGPGCVATATDRGPAHGKAGDASPDALVAAGLDRALRQRRARGAEVANIDVCAEAPRRGWQEVHGSGEGGPRPAVRDTAAGVRGERHSPLSGAGFRKGLVLQHRFCPWDGTWFRPAETSCPVCGASRSHSRYSGLF